MTQSSAAAVLWDLGNVLVDWSPRRVFRRLLPDEAAVDSFLSNVCTMAWHSRHDAGVSFEQNRAELTARHPEHAALIEAWEHRWDEMFNGTVPGVLEIFETLHDAGVPQDALSNLPASKIAPLRSMYPFLQRMNDVVVSGEEGVIKPDPRIFEIARARMSRTPEETVFIDDRAENVEAAKAAGFDGVVFTNAEALRQALRARGLPV
jgi:HAD superfamily hydrolase (TIGR01509 family)